MATTTYRNIAGLLALLVALIHLLIAPSVGLGVDEAHYALYARHLDWSYYDHPPMVGWLLWLLTPVGLNELTLRLLPTLLYLACCTLLYRVSSTKIRSGTPARGLLAVLLFSVAPLVQLLGFGLVPEFPLLLWGLLLALVLGDPTRSSSLGYWLVVGLLLGLAGLTKYTAVLLPVGVALHWLLQRQLTAQLKQGGPYIAMAVAALLVSPVLLWNYSHDWASFSYQLAHAAGGEWQLKDLLRALLVQFIAYSPVLIVGGIASFRNISRPGIEGLLACMAAPVLLLVVAGSGNGSSLPHWSLLGWGLLVPAVSHWLSNTWQLRSIRWLAYFGNGLALLLSGFILLALAFKPLAAMPWLAPAFRDLTGWSDAAILAGELQQTHFADKGVILVGNWSQASRAAWYGWPRSVQVLDRRQGQFAYWYGSPSANTTGILIRENLDPGDKPSEPYIKMGLRCDFLQDYQARIDGVLVNHFYFYRCAGATGLDTVDTDSPAAASLHEPAVKHAY